MSDKHSMTWLLLLIVLVVFVAAACVSFRGRSAGSESTTTPNFTPNPANDKVIFVKGWEQSELTKIIHDFIEGYKKDGYTAYTIEPHKLSENVYRLTFPQDIHPLLFIFLINYLAYPIDVEVGNRSIIVGGKATLESGSERIDSSLVGHKAILYIPENDQDHDVVYVGTESGITLAISFIDMKWKRVNDARLSKEVKDLVGGG